MSVMNEEKYQSLLRKLVANARAIISYQIGLPLGCQKMSKILFWLQPFEKIQFSVFEDYRTETVSIPTGTERLYCSRDALRRYDKELVEINLKYREIVIDACFTIIEQFGKLAGKEE